MGTEGLLALVAFALMAVSAFLPWAQIYGVLGEIDETGLQVMHGDPGIWLLAWALIGGLATLFLYPRRATKKWAHDGLSDILTGIVVLWETTSDMGTIGTIASAAQTNTPSVMVQLGSGCYLAIVSGLLAIVAGIAIEAKSYAAHANLRKSGSMKEDIDVHHKPSSGLRGSFPLDEGTINEEVGSGSAGVYALGRKQNKTFHVRYFGRSDSDLNAQLKKHIGQYDSFKFEYFDSPEAAFTKQCELYHAFAAPEGKIDRQKSPRPRRNGAEMPHVQRP